MIKARPQWAATQQVGLGLLLGGVLLVMGSDALEQAPAPPETQALAGPVVAVAQEGPPSASTPLNASTPQPRTTPAPNTPSTASVSAVREPLPQALSIPELGIQSQLLHLGLDQDGELEVPSGENYHQAAWYQGSPRPGESGPSIIQGHVESVRWGPSVFHQLPQAKAGTRVEVQSGETTHTFVVYRVEHYPKSEFPTFEVYQNTSGAELRLITCSGEIGPDGHYDHNTVVYAQLL